MKKLSVFLAFFVGVMCISVGLTGCGGPVGPIGSAGSSGLRGSDGAAIVTDSVPASLAECSVSGTTIRFYTDVNNNKAADAADVLVNQVTLCDAGSSLTIVEIVDPCNDAANIIDEVLLVLSNGQVLASMSDAASGQNTRLVVVPPGTYNTTDGSACQFTVTAAGLAR